MNELIKEKTEEWVEADREAMKAEWESIENRLTGHGLDNLISCDLHSLETAFQAGWAKGSAFNVKKMQEEMLKGFSTDT